MTRFPPLDIRHPQPGDIVSDEVNVAGFINVGDAVAAVSVQAEDGSELASAVVRSPDFGSGDFAVTLAVTPTSPIGTAVVTLMPDIVTEIPITFGSAFFGSFLGFGIHTVVAGDTLWDIATKNYGDGAKYPIIAVANRDVVDDPDLIFPGQELRIPVDPSAI
jgi:nucleoid-associated protein YgaU